MTTEKEVKTMFGEDAHRILADVLNYQEQLLLDANKIKTHCAHPNPIFANIREQETMEKISTQLYNLIYGI